MFTYFPPAMTMVVLGMRGEALERRQKQAEFEARDKDAWARELVGKEIEVDGVGHLQAVLDLRPLQTRCKELESSLPNNYVQYLDEAWSPEEVQAVQRAIDNVTLPVHDVDL